MLAGIKAKLSGKHKRREKLEIRPARREDAPAVVAMVHALAAHEGKRAPRFDERLFLRDFGRRDPLASAPVAQMDIIWMKGKPAGFVHYAMGYDLGSGTKGVQLGDLFVSEPYRGQGVGRALMAHLSQVSLNAGGEWVAWSMLAHNSTAMGFYEYLGAVMMKEVRRMAIGRPTMLKLAEEK